MKRKFTKWHKKGLVADIDLEKEFVMEENSNEKTK